MACKYCFRISCCRILWRLEDFARCWQNISVLGKYSLVGYKSFAKPTAFSGPYPSRSWSSEQYQTVSCSFPVVKLPHHPWMHVESVGTLVFISVVPAQFMLHLLRKQKIPKAFLCEFQYQGASYCLWWHWLVHMRMQACLPLNSCGPQGRKSIKVVPEVLLY